MILIVDTNVIISAALRQSITQDILFNKSFQFYTPEFVRQEIEEHTQELLEKSNYSLDEFTSILSLLFSKITIVPESEYMPYKEVVLKFSPDKDDWPFLALAKHLNAGLWSYDSDLKLRQNLIKVYTTSDLVKFLRNEL